MTSSIDDESRVDLLSDITDLDSVRSLIADMHDDLTGRVQRFRYLADLGAELGPAGTMLFGGAATFNAWGEVRSSFIYGNYVAVVLLSRALVEILLAAFLHAGLLTDDLPPRVPFQERLKRCRTCALITDEVSIRATGDDVNGYARIGGAVGGRSLG